MTGVFYVPLRSHGGGADTEKESAKKVNSGEENSPAAPGGIRTLNLSIWSPVLLPTSYPRFSFTSILITSLKQDAAISDQWFVQFDVEAYPP